MIFSHALPADGTTDCRSYKYAHNDSGYHEECADFHAKDDSGRSIVVEGILAVEACVEMLRLYDRVFVGR